MGKFLKDSQGNPVAIDGGLVLEKNLDRKPRDCEQCGFNKWVKKDKIFIIQRTPGGVGGAIPTETGGPSHRMSAPPPSFGSPNGGMEWICPDCALQRGLPAEHYHKNFYASPSKEAIQLLQQQQQTSRSSGKGANAGCESASWTNLLDLTGFMCS